MVCPFILHWIACQEEQGSTGEGSMLAGIGKDKNVIIRHINSEISHQSLYTGLEENPWVVNCVLQQ